MSSPEKEYYTSSSLVKYPVHLLRYILGILQEHAVNRILRDLVQLLEPVSMIVEADYKERGGLKTKAVAKYHKDQPQA